MRHALVITHAGSGGTLLCNILGSNLKVRCVGRTDICYNHPSILSRVREFIDDKLNLKVVEHNDWYVDKLIYNFNFTCKKLYKICKFVYMVRSPKVTLINLLARGYHPRGAEAYYLFRLRRMCEMSVHTGGGLLTYEDLITKRAFPLLQNMLDLKSQLSDEFIPWDTGDPNLSSGKILKEPLEFNINVPEDVLNRCTNGYRRYLKFMETQTGLIRFAV